MDTGTGSLNEPRAPIEEDDDDGELMQSPSRRLEKGKQRQMDDEVELQTRVGYDPIVQQQQEQHQTDPFFPFSPTMAFKKMHLASDHEQEDNEQDPATSSSDDKPLPQIRRANAKDDNDLGRLAPHLYLDETTGPNGAGSTLLPVHFYEDLLEGIEVARKTDWDNLVERKRAERVEQDSAIEGKKRRPKGNAQPRNPLSVVAARGPLGYAVPLRTHPLPELFPASFATAAPQVASASAKARAHVRSATEESTLSNSSDPMTGRTTDLSASQRLHVPSITRFSSREVLRGSTDPDAKGRTDAGVVTRVYACSACLNPIAMHSAVVSRDFHGTRGAAYLVAALLGQHDSAELTDSDEEEDGDDVIVSRGRPIEKHFTTGVHTVRELRCAGVVPAYDHDAFDVDRGEEDQDVAARCDAILGWSYVDAQEESEQYKIGKSLLERKALVKRWVDLDQFARGTAKLEGASMAKPSPTANAFMSDGEGEARREKSWEMRRLDQLLFPSKPINPVLQQRTRIFDSLPMKTNMTSSGDGEAMYTCASCGVHLALMDELISKAFSGREGKAYLFHTVLNAMQGEEEQRHLLTGLHLVADLKCGGCRRSIGWTYVKAFESSQKYKEGKYILEKSSLRKHTGWI